MLLLEIGSRACLISLFPHRLVPSNALLVGGATSSLRPSPSLCVSPLSLSTGLSPSPSRRGQGGDGRRSGCGHPPRPPPPSSLTCLSPPFLPPLHHSLSPSLSRRWWARGGGGCQATTPLRAPCRHGRGSVASSLSPILRAGSSTPPPAGELVLLCSTKP